MFEISTTQFGAHGATGTEEGLTRYAKRWIAGKNVDEHTDTLEKANSYFRWGSTEDASYQQPDELFPAVNTLHEQAQDQELYNEYGGSVWNWA